MSMTGSMCVSMTGRPTFAQRQNEQRRQSYGYYQVAKAIKALLDGYNNGVFINVKETEETK